MVSDNVCFFLLFFVVVVVWLGFFLNICHRKKSIYEKIAW